LLISTWGQIIDVIQTVTLVYIVIRLERALRGAAASLNSVLEGLRDTSKRLDALERERGSGGA
jgi:hypothetical protein